MKSKRGTLSKSKITTELTQALENAAALMERHHQRVMTADMLLLALATTADTDAYELLRGLSGQSGFDWNEFVRDVERAAADRRSVRDEQFDVVTGGNRRTPLSQELLVVLDEGLSLAESGGAAQCNSVYALAIMADIQISTHWLLNRRGITPALVLAELRRPAGVEASEPAAAPTGTTSNTIYHRPALENRLINLLSLKSARNVILVGPAGVGKRSLVLGVAQQIAAGKALPGLSHLIEIDEKRLLDDPVAAVRRAIGQARGGILLVTDIARFFGGIRAEFREEAGTELQKAFLMDDLVIIGTAPEDVYSKKLKPARVVAERSQVMRVSPASVEESEAILQTIKPRFERDYELTIIDKSLIETVRLAGRYYTVKPLPGAAVELLHRACAMVKTVQHNAPQTGAKNDKQLDPDDVMITASMLTGIPVTNMGADERNRYINMVAHLQQRIIGQEAAVMALSRAVKMARVGLKDPKRPIGSFLFLGPTGVGKSELAKALAEFLFGTEQALITLDMSEYMEPSSVNRLIGSPPGYVGHESGGQLTDAVKKQPYSVVLFDEVEKADRKVFDTLLQVMDEGRLTSGMGETVRFGECVILMTSNIGGHHLADVRLDDDFTGVVDDDDEAGRPRYNRKNIGRLLDDGFDAAELVTVFGEEPALAGAFDEIDDIDDKAGMIEALLDLAEQKMQFDLLLELAETYNAAKYEVHEPYFNWAVACQRAEEALKSHFRPEFLNRLDDIIYFHPLGDTHLRKILGLMLKQEEQLLANQALKLEVTEPAKTWLLAQNEHPEWGARPLRRLIQRHIREGLAEYLLRGSPSPGTVMRVQIQNGQLKITQN